MICTKRPLKLAYGWGYKRRVADRASYGVALEIIEAHATPFVRRFLGATLGINSHCAYVCVGAKLALSSPIFGRESLKGISVDEPTIDRAALERLAKALVFICGADHPTTVALRTAAQSGSEPDLKAARAAFSKFKPSDRRAALAMTAE